MTLRVLHIVPDSVNRPDLFYLGTTKDIECRREYFRARGMVVQERAVIRRDDKMRDQLAASPWVSPIDIIFWDVPGFYPRSVAFLLEREPRARLLVRSFNAEVPHRLDYARVTPGWRAKGEFLRQAAAFFFYDRWLGRVAQAVLPISDWDAGYWRRMSARARVAPVPYFLPDLYERRLPRGSKENLCVCVGSVRPGVFIDDATWQFISMVDGLKGKIPDWRFAVTSSRFSLRVKGRVEFWGFDESPFRFLSAARALALLSPLGRGFKTKILDAIAAGAAALVPPDLFRRMPEELKPFCRVVRRGVPADLARALETLPVGTRGSPNEDLRRRAFTALDRVFETVPQSERIPVMVG